MTESIEYIQGGSYKTVPAPFWKRTLAFIVDISYVTLIQYIVLLLLFLFVVAIVFVFSMIFTNVSFEATAQKLATQWQDQAFGLFHLGIILLILLAFAVMYLVLAGFIHGYFIYYEYKQNTTKGKKLFGLKLISINGAPITLKQCMIREMMRWIELPLILPALISILATKRRQRLGDLMAAFA